MCSKHKPSLGIGVESGNDVCESFGSNGCEIIKLIQGNCPIEVFKLFLYELQRKVKTTLKTKHRYVMIWFISTLLPISAPFRINAPFKSIFVKKCPIPTSDSYKCPYSNKRHSNKDPSRNWTSKMPHQNAFIYQCKWHCLSYRCQKRLKFPHGNWTFTVYLLLLQLILLFLFK